MSQASRCSQISSAQNSRNVYRFESDLPRYVARYDCSLRHVTHSQAQAHTNIGHVFDAEDEPCPETRCNQWTSMQDLTDMAWHGHGSVVSIPALQFFPSNETPVFVERWYREILVLKACFRIRLVMVWNHLESTCNESASNSQKLEQGARSGLLCRYKRERTKTRRSSRWSLCGKICIYLKEARREIKRLLVKRATVRVSTCVRHSCMCKEPKDSAFEVSAKMCRPVSHGPRCRAHLCKMPECSRLNAWSCLGDRWSTSISRQWVIDTRLAAFNLRVAALHFQMTDGSLEDLEVKSRGARTTTLGLPIIWWTYPARGCVV